jgi:hypothetical protein
VAEPRGKRLTTLSCLSVLGRLGLPDDRDPAWGWRSLVGPDLSLASVAPDHHSIMRQPAVSELAVLVAQAIAGGT